MKCEHVYIKKLYSLTLECLLTNPHTGNALDACSHNFRQHSLVSSLFHDHPHLQRISRYPLYLGAMLEYTEAETEEKIQLQGTAYLLQSLLLFA